MSIQKTEKSIGIEYNSFDVPSSCGNTLRLTDATVWYKKDVVLATMTHYGWAKTDTAPTDEEIEDAMLHLANDAVPAHGYTVNGQFYPLR